MLESLSLAAVTAVMQSQNQLLQLNLKRIMLRQSSSRTSMRMKTKFWRKISKKRIWKISWRKSMKRMMLKSRSMTWMKI
jgi:hemolysin activation/secretion protein